MNPTDWFYILPTIIFSSLLVIYCYFIEKQVLYFRVSVDNPLDLDYTDYVENYPFFDKINKRLESYLVLYVKEHFYCLGVPYKYIKVTASTNFEEISIACYVEITRKQQKIVQSATLSSVNIAAEVREFYQFIETVKNPKYEYITKVRVPESQKHVLAN